MLALTSQAPRFTASRLVPRRAISVEAIGLTDFGDPEGTPRRRPAEVRRERQRAAAESGTHVSFARSSAWHPERNGVRLSEALFCDLSARPPVVRCRCESELGPAGDSFKRFAAMARFPVQRIGPEVNPHQSRGPILAPGVYCPGCFGAAEHLPLEHLQAVDLPLDRLTAGASRPRKQGDDRYRVARPGCYILCEALQLFEEVLQVVREGLDDQLMDSGVGVPLDLLDDGAGIAVKRGRGIYAVDRAAYPRQDTQRDREVILPAVLIHGGKGATDIFG